MSADNDERIGVGPYEKPWPDDPRLCPELLASGDRRNVVDRYRYWRVEAIAQDLAERRHGFHVAAENWQRDPNLGALVRNANAFGAAAVHIIGKRRWNRRGAMMTELYTPIQYHDGLADLLAWAGRETLPVLGIDNVERASDVRSGELPARCVLLFGQEGPGLSAQARAACTRLLAIEQYGSTRSINVGAASAVVMYEWCRRYATR